jgi:DNA-binding IclR family transcriptional regulator
VETLNTDVIKTPNRYGTVPIDFLAKRLGRSASEMQTILDKLTEMGFVEVDGEKVTASKHKV